MPYHYVDCITVRFILHILVSNFINISHAHRRYCSLFRPMSIEYFSDWQDCELARVRSICAVFSVVTPSQIERRFTHCTWLKGTQQYHG